MKPLEVYQANPVVAAEVASEVEYKSDLERPGAQSPVVVFADRMAQDVMQELVSLDRGSKYAGGTMTASRPDNLAQNTYGHRTDLETILYFSQSLKAIETMLIDGEYDPTLFAKDINSKVGEYAGNKISIAPDAQPIMLEESVLKQMHDMAKSDPFFSTIIQREDLLPREFIAAINNGKSDRLTQIHALLPLYREITDALPKRRPSPLDVSSLRRIQLDDADEMVKRHAQELDELRSTMHRKDKPVEQQADEKHIPHWLGLLANKYIVEGGEEYKSKIESSHANQQIAINSIYLDKPLAPSRTKVFVGSTIFAIEDMIRTGAYNHESFAARMNAALGSGTVKIDVREPFFTELSDDQYKSLISLAKEDPSFAIFFEHPSLLPDLIAREIKRHQLEAELPGKVADHKATAMALHALYEDKAISQEDQKVMLHKLDKITDDLDNDIAEHKLTETQDIAAASTRTDPFDTMLAGIEVDLNPSNEPIKIEKLRWNMDDQL